MASADPLGRAGDQRGLAVEAEEIVVFHGDAAGFEALRGGGAAFARRAGFL
jgi:hypothetical protein